MGLFRWWVWDAARRTPKPKRTPTPKQVLEGIVEEVTHGTGLPGSNNGIRLTGPSAFLRNPKPFTLHPQPHIRINPMMSKTLHSRFWRGLSRT